MEKKIILQELCSTLEKQLNEYEGSVRKRTVEFFSGAKPFNYYLPAIHTGTTKSIPAEIKMAWYVEISVDGKVVFRDSYLPQKGGNFEGAEELLINRVLSEIFRFGVMSSREMTNRHIVDYLKHKFSK